ncbi:5850_t:CDS:2, partial [Funneliformis geosporum]
ILPQDEMDDIIEHDDQDFIHIDDCLKGSKGLIDDEIVSMVKLMNNEPVIYPNKGPLEVILIKKALGYLDDIVLFFEYSSNILINSDKLNILKKLR